MPEISPEEAQSRFYYQQILDEMRRRRIDISPKMTDVSGKNITDELIRRGYSPVDIQEQMNQYVTQETTKWEHFKEELPELAGGAVYGARFGAAFGWPGALGGAFVGGITGKAFQQVHQALTGSVKAPKTSAEAAEEMAKSGFREAAYEAGGRVAMKGAIKATAPIFRKLKPEILPFAREGQKEMVKYGSHLTPAQMTESGLIDTLEEIAERGFISRGTMQKFKGRIQQEALGKWTKDLADSFAESVTERLSPEEIGIVFRDIFAGENETFKAVGRTLYGKVDELTGNNPIVDLRPIKTFAQEVYNIAKERHGIGDTHAGMKMLKNVLKFSDNITFKQAQSIRSGFGDEIYNMAVNRDKAAGIAKKFYGLMDETMDSASKKLGGNANAAWRKADRFWKESKEAFSNETLRRLAIAGQKNPEFVTKAVFQNKAITKIKTVKRLLKNHPDAWQNMKASWVSDLLEKGSDVDGIILGKSFLKKYNAMGNEALNEILTPVERKNIELLAETARMIESRTGGSGGMLIQLTQAGPIIGFATGAVFREPMLAAGGGFILAAPWVVAKMAQSTKFTNWIVTGMKMPNTSAAAGTLATRLIATVKRIEEEYSRPQKAENLQ